MKSSEGRRNGVTLSDQQFNSVNASGRQIYNVHLHSISLILTHPVSVKVSRIECKWVLYDCLSLCFTDVHCRSLSVTPFCCPSLDFIGHGYSKYSISYFCPENPLIQNERYMSHILAEKCHA